MKAIPVIYEGIQFRSKLEARWYIFMKSMGWDVEYEPEVNCNRYIPDFKIRGRLFDIYIEVKPIENWDDWFGKNYEQFREKVQKSELINSLTEYHCIYKYLEFRKTQPDIPYHIDEFPEDMVVPTSTTEKAIRKDQGIPVFNPFTITQNRMDDDYKKKFLQKAKEKMGEKTFEDFKNGLVSFRNPKRNEDARLFIVVGANIDRRFGYAYLNTEYIASDPKSECMPIKFCEGHVAGSDFREITGERNYEFDLRGVSILNGQIIQGQFWNDPEKCDELSVRTKWNEAWSKLQWKSK
tara:strand:- start:97 stop:978 length:882 start_codon:yes stop_codon:yes gene_type:complete